MDSHCYIVLVADPTDPGADRTAVVDHIDPEADPIGLVVDHCTAEGDHTAVGPTDFVEDRCTDPEGVPIGFVAGHYIEVVEGHIELVEDTGFVADHTDFEGIGLVEDRIDCCCKRVVVEVEVGCHKKHHTAEVDRKEG